jgi:hypothetical protein
MVRHIKGGHIAVAMSGHNVDAVKLPPGNWSGLKCERCGTLFYRKFKRPLSMQELPDLCRECIVTEDCSLAESVLDNVYPQIVER